MICYTHKNWVGFLLTLNFGGLLVVGWEYTFFFFFLLSIKLIIDLKFKGLRQWRKSKVGPYRTKINIVTYFENLTVGLHVYYVLNMHVKFRVNQMLFTIWSINLFFMHNIHYLCNLIFKNIFTILFVIRFDYIIKKFIFQKFIYNFFY